ncbi:MAG: hypothetical protein U1E65_00195 [Myxococcota bacterium]
MKLAGALAAWALAGCVPLETRAIDVPLEGIRTAVFEVESRLWLVEISQPTAILGAPEPPYSVYFFRQTPSELDLKPGEVRLAEGDDLTRPWPTPASGFSCSTTRDCQPTEAPLPGPLPVRCLQRALNVSTGLNGDVIAMSRLPDGKLLVATARGSTLGAALIGAAGQLELLELPRLPDFSPSGGFVAGRALFLFSQRQAHTLSIGADGSVRLVASATLSCGLPGSKTMRTAGDPASLPGRADIYLQPGVLGLFHFDGQACQALSTPPIRAEDRPRSLVWHPGGVSFNLSLTDLAEYRADTASITPSHISFRGARPPAVAPLIVRPDGSAVAFGTVDSDAPLPGAMRIFERAGTGEGFVEGNNGALPTARWLSGAAEFHGGVVVSGNPPLAVRILGERACPPVELGSGNALFAVPFDEETVAFGGFAGGPEARTVISLVSVAPVP